MQKVIEIRLTKVINSRTVRAVLQTEDGTTIEDTLESAASAAALGECFKTADVVECDVEKSAVEFIFRREPSTEASNPAGRETSAEALESAAV